MATHKKKKPAKSERSDELEAAVLADPSAEAPRLVYADWLQSQGDPRGELATVQHALQTAKGVAWAKLKAQERTLLDEHAAALYGPLVKWKRGRLTGVDWRCGFVDGLRGDDFKDEDTARQFIAEHPSARFIRVVDDVDVGNAVPPCLEVLRTYGSRMDAVLKHPGLRVLESSLEGLQLPKNFTHPTLERLVVEDATRALPVLARAKLPALKYLGLGLRTRDVAAVTKALTRVKCDELALTADAFLEELPLAGLSGLAARITQLGIRHTVDFSNVEFPRLRTLIVESGEGDGEVFAALHAALPALEAVELRYPTDRVRFFRAFVTSAAAKKVKSFRVQVSKPAAGLALTEGTWDSLTHLDLSFDTTFSLQFLKAEELLAAKCWANLKSLRLAPGAVGLLTKAPLASSLETLTLHVDRPSSAWKQALAPLKKLKTLVLEGPRQLEPADLLELGVLEALGIELVWAPRVA